MGEQATPDFEPIAEGQLLPKPDACRSWLKIGYSPKQAWCIRCGYTGDHPGIRHRYDGESGIWEWDDKEELASPPTSFFWIPTNSKPLEVPA